MSTTSEDPPPKDSAASALVSAETVAALPDDLLEDLIQLAIHEQRERAIAAADPDALVELGFAEGFRSNGLPIEPWIVEGIIVCPGARIDKSATSHDCAFVAVGDDWVWQYDERLADVIRQIPAAKPRMQSVSLIAAYEGLELDWVQSKMKNGVHEMQKAQSYVIKEGELCHVTSRARRPDHSR